MSGPRSSALAGAGGAARPRRSLLRQRFSGAARLLALLPLALAALGGAVLAPTATALAQAKAPPAAGKDAAPRAAPAGEPGNTPSRPGGDVMDGRGSTPGALLGTGGTTGGPAGFGGPRSDPEVLERADAPSGMVDPLRGVPRLLVEPRPAAMPETENRDIRRNRSYVLQPPTIPHKVDSYQIDRNANRCMLCHARTRIEESRAIPVSITHYSDRDGNVLAEISPRRWFCDQCHVVQTVTNPLVDNRYIDVEAMLARDRGANAGARGGPAPAQRDTPAKGAGRAAQPGAAPPRGGEQRSGGGTSPAGAPR